MLVSGVRHERKASKSRTAESTTEGSKKSQFFINACMLLKKHKLLKFGSYTIDLAERTLWRDEELVPLAPKVMETLCVLVENHGRLMTKDELFARIWGDTFVEERNLTQNIFTLRKSLGETDDGEKLIETVPRRGYRFVARVRPVPADNEKPEAHLLQPGLAEKDSLREVEKESPLSNFPGEENKKEQGQKANKNGNYRRATAYAGIILVVVAGLAVLWSWQFRLFGAGSALPEPVGQRETLEFERMTDSGKVYFPTISPNKEFFAYVQIDRRGHSIGLQNLATGSRTIVVEPGEREISRPRFSADGNYLFFRQDEAPGKPGIIYQVPVLGGTPRQIATQVSSDFSLSPDGQWLAFFRILPRSEGQTLIICRSSDGGGERILATRTGNSSFAVWGNYPSWSPDGTHVFARLREEPMRNRDGVSGDGFWLIDVNEGKFLPVKVPEWNTFIQVEWMPDGKSLLFLAQEKPNGPFQIWQVSYPSGEGRKLTNDLHDYRYISIAPDGAFLLVTLERRFSNLWTIPVEDTSRPTQLTFSSELLHGDQGISWTPDGKDLVFTLLENHVDGNIWTINTETHERRQLTFDQGAVNWYPSVTPDGRSIIFSSNREGGTHIWQIDIEGNNLRQITEGDGESFSNISADGKWLVYASPAWAPEALLKRSLFSDEPTTRFSVRAGGSSSISPDGKHLIVSYKTEDEFGQLVYRYGLMSFAGDDTPKDLGFHPYKGAIAWKPDSSGFFYIKYLGKNLTNIWYYDLVSKTHRKIADFNDKIRSLSLSPDGSSLATARGEEISNVFKITGF